MSTLTFTLYNDREATAAMLESPIREMLEDTNSDPPLGWFSGLADVKAILAELDRIDTAAAARSALRIERNKFDAAAIEADVNIVPAGPGDVCEKRNYTGYRRSTGAVHKARVLINGYAYCGTHEKRALETYERRAILAHAAEYVPNPALKAVVDADNVVRDERMKAKYG